MTAARKFDLSVGEKAAHLVLHEWRSKDLDGNHTAFYLGQFAKAKHITYERGKYLVENGMDKCEHYNPENGPHYLDAFDEGFTTKQTKETHEYISQAAANDNERRNFSIVTQDVVATQFAELNKGKLLYCHSQGAWFEWNGSIWRKNETKKAFSLARLLSRQLSSGLQPKDKKQIQSSGFARGVEKFAEADPIFSRTASDWDKGLWQLGTPDGTVDLRTGKLMPASPDDMITKSTAIAPGDAVTCTRWLQFLAEATGDDAELIRFLQQWSGYSLTGVTREHALVFMYGGGGNGKSVFLNTVTGILADYATTAAMETFTASHYDKHPTDLAMLRGARLVTASETEQGKAWAESRIKQITGGDPISARFMRQDFFTYMPQFKLTIIGNYRPVLHNVDDAARRRFNIVPFTRTPPKVDRQLEAKLRFEWPGILRWMIEGCLDWQRNGLARPESIVSATEAYFSEQDLFGQWLEDCCDVNLDSATMWDLTGSLFDSWEKYAETAGEKPGSAKSFAESLRKRGFSPKRTKTARGFIGVRLKGGPPANQ